MITLNLFENGLFEIRTKDGIFEQDKAFRPHVKLRNSVLYFDEARLKSLEKYSTGTQEGFIVRYMGYDSGASFEIIVSKDTTNEHISASFVALNLKDVVEVNWPAPFVFDKKGEYTVLTHMQGLLLPSDYDKEIKPLPFDGQMCSSAAYMPWFGQVGETGAYIAYVREPWDTALKLNHKVGGPTRTHTRLLPSLGEMQGQRKITYVFFEKGADYVSLCKQYREFAKEDGLLVKLSQKALYSQNVEDLIGASVLHRATKKNVVPESYYYNREDESKNKSVVTFSENEKLVNKLTELGAPKMYLHLDGWGEPGYDNKHPDYLPVCKAAGGYEGIKSLRKACKNRGHLFGLHDQYRDYYFDAPTFNSEQAVLLADNTLFEHARWAGGRQTYLCSMLALDYVRRNFTELKKNGIDMDCVYLDVFTCNEPDECINPHHRVTRRESLEYRLKCFRYMLSLGIVPSSEEAVDWALPALVFCHWAPYASFGIPVPLFNLVYHDCFLIPWKLGKGEWGTPENQLGFLHALLNAGMGYVEEELEGDELQNNFEQLRVVSALQKRLAHVEMLKHEFLSEDKLKQRSTFKDGTTVTVDFEKETYEISPKL